MPATLTVRVLPERLSSWCDATSRFQVHLGFVRVPRKTSADVDTRLSALHSLVVRYMYNDKQMKAPLTATLYVYIRHLHFSPSPPLDNIRVMVIVWRLRGNIIRILSEQLCAGLCDTMFAVRSTLTGAVLQVQQIGLSLIHI